MAHISRPPTQGHPKYPTDRANTLYIVRFVKSLFDAEVARDLGANAITLLFCIVFKEDDLIYRQPVLLFNDYLQHLTGLTKHTLPVAREKAVEAGWLHYEEGGKSIPGTYWTIIPTSAAKISEAKRSNNSLFRTPIIHPENREGKLDSKDLSPAIRTLERETNAICHPENRETNAVCHPENRDHIDSYPNTPPTQKTGWGEVEARLKEIGLTTAELTVREAIAHGCSPPLAMCIAEHFALHPGAWQSPGIVRAAMLNHSPSLPADHPDRWPKPSEEYEAAKRSKAMDKEQSLFEARRKAKQEEIQAELKQRETRATRYGPLLDSMSESEQLAMCETETHRNHVQAAFATSKPLIQLTRNFLLRAIEKRCIDQGNLEDIDGDDSHAILQFPRKVS